MPFIPYIELCPEKGDVETRKIQLFQNTNKLGLPIGSYVFIELFCNECDCRRAMFNVFKDNESVAVISWGWESYSFYRKWLGADDKELIKEMQGTELNMMSPQSKLAPKVLAMFKMVLLSDKSYTERVKTHYHEFRIVLLNQKNRNKK
ncbi:MAG: hypothetical protein ACOYO1_12215 [Bacteroidales bacterium]